MPEKLTEADVNKVAAHAGSEEVYNLCREWREQRAALAKWPSEWMKELAERDKRIAALEKLTGQLSIEEAQAAYDAAEPIPISRERIEKIVKYATRETRQLKALSAWADRVEEAAKPFCREQITDALVVAKSGFITLGEIRRLPEVLAERPK